MQACNMINCRKDRESLFQPTIVSYNTHHNFKFLSSNYFPDSTRRGGTEVNLIGPTFYYILPDSQILGYRLLFRQRSTLLSVDQSPLTR